MKQEIQLNLALITMKTEMWIDIVLLQVDRITEENKILRDITAEERNLNTSWDTNTQRIADEHLLRVALLKFKEWAIELSKITREGTLWLKEIQKYDSISDLRNMSEHELDYYKGKGHFQDRFLNEANGLNALETGVSEDDYLIGGRLSLRQTKKSFKHLKEQISKNNFTIKIECIKELEKYI